MQLSPLLKVESAKAKLPFSNVPRYGPAGASELVVGDGDGLGRAGPVVRVGLGLREGVAVAVGVGDGRGDDVGVGDGEVVGRGVDVAVGEGVGDGEVVGVGEGVGDGVANGSTVGLPSPGHVCESLIPESEFRIVA